MSPLETTFLLVTGGIIGIATSVLCARVWEFIERSGSYLCPIALVMVDTWLRRNPEADRSTSTSIQHTNRHLQPAHTG